MNQCCDNLAAIVWLIAHGHDQAAKELASSLDYSEATWKHIHDVMKEELEHGCPRS